MVLHCLSLPFCQATSVQNFRSQIFIVGECFNWRKACVEREDIHAQWSDTNQNFHHFMYRDGFYAAVDVVHLLKVCINFYLAGPGSF